MARNRTLILYGLALVGFVLMPQLVSVKYYL